MWANLVDQLVEAVAEAARRAARRRPGRPHIDDSDCGESEEGAAVALWRYAA